MSEQHHESPYPMAPRLDSLERRVDRLEEHFSQVAVIGERVGGLNTALARMEQAAEKAANLSDRRSDLLEERIEALEEARQERTGASKWVRTFLWVAGSILVIVFTLLQIATLAATGGVGNT